jgi:hypothetical protein
MACGSALIGRAVRRTATVSEQMTRELSGTFELLAAHDRLTAAAALAYNQQAPLRDFHAMRRLIAEGGLQRLRVGGVLRDFE